MPNYLIAYFYMSCIISLPALLTILDGIMKDNRLESFIGLTVFSLLWISVVLLHNSVKFAHAISIIVVGLFWCPLLLQTLGRMYFIIIHGGMDSADKPGSPLAFLIGMAAEQFLFIPLSLLLFLGLRDIYRNRKKKTIDNTFID